jgi:NitT/TauT family transport system ATP-binding protein
MIRLQKLTFAYPHQTPVFQDFTWGIKPGEMWAILGPSGCGKSTLLYLLAGLRFPSGGQVSINNKPLIRPRPHTGLIIQEYGLLPWATVRQNAELGQRIRVFYGPDGTHAPENFQPDKSVDPWLERLHLLPLADKYPSQISGGQRQRTAIARTLALEPDLLLMNLFHLWMPLPVRDFKT